MALLASILLVQINSLPSVIMTISEVLVFMAKTSRFLINVGGRSVF